MYNDPYGLDNNEGNNIALMNNCNQITYENTHETSLNLNKEMVSKPSKFNRNSTFYENSVILENVQYDQPWDLSQMQNQLQENFSKSIDQQAFKEPITSQSKEVTKKIYDRMVQSMYENAKDFNQKEHVISQINDSEIHSPSSRDEPSLLQIQRMQISMNQAIPKKNIDGYDEPWDLQPHRKDDRGEEGYDKPWDLRPHLKDERPSSEYDDPWDEKMKKLQNQFKNPSGLQKIPNPNKPMAIKPGVHSNVSHKRPNSEILSSSQNMPKSTVFPAKLNANLKIVNDAIKVPISKLDLYPPKFKAPLEPPHIQNSNKIPGPSQNQFSNIKSSLTPNDISKNNDNPNLNDWQFKVPPNYHNSDNNKINKPKSSNINQKVLFDANLTLEQQNWYHGTISRTEAEVLLRPGKEGSFLVRTSETNKKDNSLSVKSLNGFIHMKIVPDMSGKFVLGQYSQPFASIPLMILHYSQHKLPIKGAEHISLLYPINSELL